MILTLWLSTVLSAAGAALPAEQKPAANPPRISACALLARDVVAKLAPRVVLNNPPSETPAGPNGSYCDYGPVGWQIDPFVGADQIRKSPRTGWVPMTGVGETAYFNNVRDFYAELIVWSGRHHMAILMEVPAGTTAEQLKPNLIQLANLLIPKLK